MILGAGTPTGAILVHALSEFVPVIGADADPVGRGQVVSSPKWSLLLPAATDRRFVPDLLSAAIRHTVSLIIPTRNIELPALSAHRKEFAHYGIDLLVERPDTLETCLDKFQLMAHCAQEVKVPLTLLLDASLSQRQLLSLGVPFLVESRYRNASRVRIRVTDPTQLIGLPRDGSLIASQILPGSDFVVDVLSRSDGHVVAAVPQSPQRTVAGRVVPARTVANRDLQDFARRVAGGIGATHVVSVLARRRDDGIISLVDVFPRFVHTVAASIVAGVNMPVLAAAAVLGAELPDDLDFEEVEAGLLSGTAESPAVSRATKADQLLAIGIASSAEVLASDGRLQRIS
jgi:carbamoyl-phosphate synthase large subunit